MPATFSGCKLTISVLVLLDHTSRTHRAEILVVRDGLVGSKLDKVDDAALVFIKRHFEE